jgi:hypothetical protein
MNERGIFSKEELDILRDGNVLGDFPNIQHNYPAEDGPHENGGDTEEQ